MIHSGRLSVSLFLLVLSMLWSSAGKSEESTGPQAVHRLWAGPILGLSLLESSLNNGEFAPGFAYGLKVDYEVFEIGKHSLGLGISYFDMSNVVDKGTPQISVVTGYSRAASTVNYIYSRPGFYWGARAGLGLTFITNEVQFVFDQKRQLSSTGGVDPGFLGGLSIGSEIGRRFLGLNKGIRLGSAFEWNRRGRRDEFSVLVELSFQFIDRVAKISLK